MIPRQRECGLVAARPCGGPNSLVLLAIGIREEAAADRELVFEVLARFAKLSKKLLILELRQVGMGNGMGANLESALDEVSELRPAHRREMFRVPRQLRSELRDVERSIARRECGAREHRRGYAESLQKRQRRTDASECVVERHVHQASAPGYRLAGVDRPVTAREHSLQLLFQRAEGNGEYVVPSVRDRVVAQHERS